MTPDEVMAVLRIKDRHTLDRLVERGRIERFNVSGGEKQARWKYRLKPLEPESPAPSEEDLQPFILLPDGRTVARSGN